MLSGVIIVPSLHMRYAMGWASAVRADTSLSTKKNTMGTNSTALYAATHNELKRDTPANPEKKP